MNLIIYLKGDYEEFHALTAAKNKPNSKPNKAKCRPLAGNPNLEILNPKRIEWVPNDRFQRICQDTI